MRTQCPHCQTKLNVSDEHKGKQAKCPKCSGQFVLEPVNEVNSEEISTGSNEQISKEQTPKIVICKECEEEMHKGEQVYIMKDRSLCEECWTTSTKEILKIATHHRLFNYLILMSICSFVSVFIPPIILPVLFVNLYFVFKKVPVWLRAIDVSIVGRILYCTGIFLLPFFGVVVQLTLLVKLLRRVGVSIVGVVFFVLWLLLTTILAWGTILLFSLLVNYLIGLLLLDYRARAYLKDYGLRMGLLGADLNEACPQTITYKIGE